MALVEAVDHSAEHAAECFESLAGALELPSVDDLASSGQFEYRPLAAVAPGGTAEGCLRPSRKVCYPGERPASVAARSVVICMPL